MGGDAADQDRNNGNEVVVVGEKDDGLVFHDEVELEDFEYDEDDETYYYPCPCGDRFAITKEELESGEEVATCPSCSLIVKVIYDKDDFFDNGGAGPALAGQLSNLRLIEA